MERKSKMKNFKKIISMLLAVVMVFSVAASSDALTVQASSAKWKSYSCTKKSSAYMERRRLVGR